jgi:predicted aspartyl protease
MFAALSKIVLFSVILALSAGGVAADPAEELLQKHLEALGGEAAVLGVTSVVSSSEIELLGIGVKGKMLSHQVMPCLFRSDISLGFFSVKQGYDGERIWRVDQNGMLIYVQDLESIRDQITNCLIDSYSYIFSGDTHTARVAGIDTIDGTPCEVIELIPDGGTPCRLYLDVENHLLKRLSMETTSGPVHETYGDYRRVNGVMFPFLVRMMQASLDQTIEVRTDSIAVNGRVDPVLFLPPPETVSDYTFTQGYSAEMIPFTSYERHIYLPVRIEGCEEELMFMLDSGASMTVIDSTLAARIGLPLGERLVGAGAGGMADFYMTRIPGFSIEGVSFAEQTVIAYPISDIIRRFTDIEIGGILGYDFLSRFVARIDFERNLISLFEPDSFTAAAGETPLDAPLIHNVFSLPCSLDGRFGGTFLIDTGASNSLLQKRFTDEHGITGEHRNAEISIIGAGGEDSASLAVFDSFKIGEFVIEDPVFAVSSSERGIGAFTGISGIVGNDILSRFSVTLDYGNQKIYLARNSLFAKPFPKDRSGIMFERGKDGRIRIRSVVPGSPAEESGLAEGDIVLAIDGREASDFENLEELRELFRSGEGTVRTIDIDRAGRKMRVSVRLRDYI